MYLKKELSVQSAEDSMTILNFLGILVILWAMTALCGWDGNLPISDPSIEEDL